MGTGYRSGPSLNRTAMASAASSSKSNPLYKNSQGSEQIYDFKKRELIESGRSSLQACYDDESIDLVMQIGLQEGVVIPDRHAAI